MSQYPGVGWVDGPNGGTPLDAANLDIMDQGIADEDVRNPSSPAALALAALYGHDVRAWAPNTPYLAGQAVVSPTTGDVVTAKVPFTSTATYNAANWQARSRAVNVRDFGASPTATPAANFAAIQAAVSQAKANNQAVYIPGNPMGAPIQINQRIDVSGLTVFGDGQSSAIQQTVLGNGVFYVNAPDTTIRDLSLSSSAGLDLSSITDPTSDPTTQVSSNYCAIWIQPGSHRGTYRNLWVSGIFAAINLQMLDSAPQMTGGILIDGLTVSGVCFGILGRGWYDARFNNIRGSYTLATAGVSYPPHLIYVSNDNSASYSYNLQITNVQAWDSDTGAVVKLNGVLSGSMDNVQGYNCRGVLDILTVWDFEITNAFALNDNNGQQPGPIKATFMLQSCTRVRVRGGKITFQNIDHNEALETNGCTDCGFEDIEIVANFLIPQTDPNLTIVRIYGTNVYYRNIRVNNIGANRPSAFLVKSATNAQIVDPAVEGNIGVGFYVKDATTGTSISYDPAKIQVLNSFVNSRALYVDSYTSERLFLKTPAMPAITANLVAFNGGTRGPNDSAGIANFSSGHLVTAGGTWVYDSTAGSQKIYNSSNNSNASLLIDTGKADIDITQDIYFGGNAAGIIFRCLAGSDSDYLTADILPTGVAIQDRAAGAAPVAQASSAAMTIQTGRRYELRLLACGNQVSAYLDGVLAVSYVLTSAQQTKYGAATRHGMHAGGASSARFARSIYRALT